MILRLSPRPWQETVTRAPPAPKASSNAAPRMASADKLLPTLSANSRDTLDASNSMWSTGECHLTEHVILFDEPVQFRQHSDVLTQVLAFLPDRFECDVSFE